MRWCGLRTNSLILYNYSLKSKTLFYSNMNKRTYPNSYGPSAKDRGRQSKLWRPDTDCWLEICDKLKEKFTYFWRYDSPFSQHYPVEFEVDGVTFNCAEQYYMFKKAEMFGDTNSIDKIMRSCNPMEQKSLGRKVVGFDKKVWDEVSRSVVRKGNFAKFSQHEDLLQVLLSTRGTTLVEASPKDDLWGINLESDNYSVLKREWWCGKNWLGEELTKLRDEDFGKKKFSEEYFNSKISVKPVKTYEGYFGFFRSSSPFTPTHITPFEVDGQRYMSLQHYMMHQSTVFSGNEDAGRKILNSIDQQQIHHLAYNDQMFDDNIWNMNVTKIIITGNFFKFIQNPQLLSQLLNTRNTILVYYDQDCQMGIGLKVRSEQDCCLPSTRFKGRNLLGCVLTIMRDHWLEHTCKHVTLQSLFDADVSMEQWDLSAVDMNNNAYQHSKWTYHPVQQRYFMNKRIGYKPTRNIASFNFDTIKSDTDVRDTDDDDDDDNGDDDKGKHDGKKKKERNKRKRKYKDKNDDDDDEEEDGNDDCKKKYGKNHIKYVGKKDDKSNTNIDERGYHKSRTDQKSERNDKKNDEKKVDKNMSKKGDGNVILNKKDHGRKIMIQNYADKKKKNNDDGDNDDDNDNNNIPKKDNDKNMNRINAEYENKKDDDNVNEREDDKNPIKKVDTNKKDQDNKEIAATYKDDSMIESNNSNKNYKDENDKIEGVNNDDDNKCNKNKIENINKKMKNAQNNNEDNNKDGINNMSNESDNVIESNKNNVQRKPVDTSKSKHDDEDADDANDKHKHSESTKTGKSKCPSPKSKVTKNKDD